jgi:hypothetical protein
MKNACSASERIDGEHVAFALVEEVGDEWEANAAAASRVRPQV